VWFSFIFISGGMCCLPWCEVGYFGGVLGGVLPALFLVVSIARWGFRGGGYIASVGGR
jgi:hypothetical protein